MKQLIIFIVIVCSLVANGQPALPYNQSFEVPFNSIDNWRFYEKKGEYAISYSSNIKRTGKYSLLIEGKNAQRTKDDNDGGFTQIRIPNQLLAGKKKARIEAWVKTNSPATHAALWMNQYSRSNPNDPLNEDYSDSIHNRLDWQFLKVEINLIDNAYSTEFGALVNGSEQAWFDDFVLYLDDIKVKDVLKPAKEPTSTEIDWLNKNTFPLHSGGGKDDYTDLEKLGQWIGDAKVIGVGEPTHGTSETGKFRLKLFQYLTIHKGFNVFMVEDQLPECGLINDYVMGKADSALISLRLHKGEATQETYDIINWLHDYNASHQNKVQFVSMDMQSAEIALQNVKRFAAIHDDTLSSDINNLINYSEGYNKNWYDTTGITEKWPLIREA